jgi:Sigma-70 region 2
VLRRPLKNPFELIQTFNVIQRITTANDHIEFLLEREAAKVCVNVFDVGCLAEFVRFREHCLARVESNYSRKTFPQQPRNRPCAASKPRTPASFAALEKLILRHQAWIYKIAVRMVFQPQDADEVTQEVLIKAITKLKRLAKTVARP